jgi:hypothetical protein
MIQVFIANSDGIHDLFATVTDENANSAPVLNGQRINNGRQYPVNVQEDGNNQCLVNIHTVSADDPAVQRDFPGQQVLNGGTIFVTA